MKLKIDSPDLRCYVALLALCSSLGIFDRYVHLPPKVRLAKMIYYLNSGLPTIRSFGKIPRFIQDNQYYIDLENRALFITVTTQRYFSFT